MTLGIFKSDMSGVRVMNSTDLRYFAVVARLGAMSRAAAELNTVQSNVTARIRQLEASLGVELFLRESRGVSLTDAGRRLVPIVQSMERLMDEAKGAVRDDGRPRGPLVLGSLETTAAYRLAPIVIEFSANFPEVDLAIKTGTNDVLLNDVIDGRVDGAFVASPLDRSDLESCVVFAEELVVVSQAGTSLAVGPASPRTTIVVKGTGCSYRQRLEEILLDEGVGVLRRIELGSLDAILSCVAAGLGVTLLPRSVVDSSRERPKLDLRTLPGHKGRVQTLFVCRKGARKSSPLRAFQQSVDPRATRPTA